MTITETLVHLNLIIDVHYSKKTPGDKARVRNIEDDLEAGSG
jgi:hypothetical protein